MGKHMLAKAHMAQVHELTESEVTEWPSLIVHEAALGILKMQGNCGITIVRVPSYMISDIQFNPY